MNENLMEVNIAGNHNLPSNMEMLERRPFKDGKRLRYY